MRHLRYLLAGALALSLFLSLLFGWLALCWWLAGIVFPPVSEFLGGAAAANSAWFDRVAMAAGLMFGVPLVLVCSYGQGYEMLEGKTW